MQTEGDSSLKRFQRLQVLRVSSTPLAPPDASIREKAFCGFLRNSWMLGSVSADGGNLSPLQVLERGSLADSRLQRDVVPDIFALVVVFIVKIDAMFTPSVCKRNAFHIYMRLLIYHLPHANLLWTPRQHRLRKIERVYFFAAI